MKTSFLSILITIVSSLSCFSQINPDRIDIVRDKWGVPHIFAPTDAEVAYGFAWATAEDDFQTMQMLLLPGRGLAGRVLGKSGAFLDVATHLVEAYEVAKSRYEKELSPSFKKIVEAYAAGANAYAKAHPKEVMHKKLFPVTGVDVIQGYVLGMTLISQADKSLRAILNQDLDAIQIAEARGSNAFAVNSTRTTDGQTYLAINSHQPLEGVNSWYEAHLCSEEGWNILGATFAGGVSIFGGVNEYLGWAHTVNYPDMSDIFALIMHPEKKLHYRFDGEWFQLEPFHTKAKIKLLGFIPFGLKQKFYKSKYGVTIETDQGFFSWRFSANRSVKAAEQWYKMNKARNFEEFQSALRMQGITSTNIVYADRYDNIYYISNGKFPIRDPHFEWQGIVRGDTSATLWKDVYYPIDSLPQVYNPASGFVYNCNHTPFLSSGKVDNPNPAQIPSTTGYQPLEVLTNRAVRFEALISQYDKLTYEDFKRIKYDQAYHKPLNSAPKIELLFQIDPSKYPNHKSSLELLQTWDRVADAESEAAALFILIVRKLRSEVKNRKSFREGNEINEQLLISALAYAENHLQKYFGSRKVPLGTLQQHRRGNVSLPYGGGPDVLAAVSGNIQEDGTIRPRAGDSYIELARFSKEGVEIESINAYGASARPESPHYTDQMEPFTQQKMKVMTLDKEKVMAEAVKKYHPM